MNFKNDSENRCHFRARGIQIAASEETIEPFLLVKPRPKETILQLEILLENTYGAFDM